MTKRTKFQAPQTNVTGPYTAYLVALHARRTWQRQVKRDARALRALGDAQDLHKASGHSADKARVTFLEKLVDEEYQTTLATYERMREAGSDLELEREFASEDWEAIG